MKNLAEKQLLEWKEELGKQRLKQSQARKVLEETNQCYFSGKNSYLTLI